MPQLETSYLNQKAVLWPATGFDAYGQPSVSKNAVEVRVRWLTKRRQVLQPNGTTVAFDAQAVVDRKVPIGSNMWLGRLTDWNNLNPNTQDTELMLVKNYDETPDLKNRAVRRTVDLMRFKDSLGTLTQ